MNKHIIVHDLGLVDYQVALDYQLKLFNQIIDVKVKNRRTNNNIQTQNHLVFVEHPNVYTLGKSGDINNLLLNKNELVDKKIQFFNTNRGGDITPQSLPPVLRSLCGARHEMLQSRLMTDGLTPGRAF